MKRLTDHFCNKVIDYCIKFGNYAYYDCESESIWSPHDELPIYYSFTSPSGNTLELGKTRLNSRLLSNLDDDEFEFLNSLPAKIPLSSISCVKN